MKIASVPGFLTLRAQLLALVLICAVFYCNTLYNQYTLDDVIVLTENNYVKKGFSGVYNLLTKDSFYGHYGKATKLAGGRWRPLSLIVFAAEKQIFGLNPFVFHFNNLLFYTLCCLMFFALLRKFILKDNPLAVFFAAVLFAIHPIHTEAIASIKSLDELLSLLLLLTTLYYSLTYINLGNQPKHLAIALAAYFLALLAKENGVTFFAILPLSFYCFTNNNLKKALLNALPFLVVGGLYLFIRFQIVGNSQASTDLLNAPFLYATPEEKIATKLYVLGKYLCLLLLPYPLAFDYSYNQIPYVTFKNGYVIATIVIYCTLLVAGLLGLRKKNVLAYCALFYLASISIVSNFVVDIGGTLGERFLFQPSVGFAIAAGLLLSYACANSLVRNVAFAGMAALTLLCAVVVINRNADWQSNETLFIRDVEVVPNSVKANYFAGIALIDASDKQTDSATKTSQLKKALLYFKKAMRIDSTIPEVFLNEGVAYSRLNDLESAEKSWDKVRQISPMNAGLMNDEAYLLQNYTRLAQEQSMAKNYQQSIYYARKALKYDSLNAGLWYNLGAQYYNLQDYANARLLWQKTLQIDSTFAQAKLGLGSLQVVDVKK